MMMSSSALLLPLLLAAIAESASLPSFASTAISSSSTASRVNVQDHWSEIATMFRPDLSKTDFNNSQRVNCPYSAQGLKRWSDKTIWPNSAVPAANTWTSITIPAGVSVLVSAGDLSTSVYGYITIPANSKLVFADADITLHTLGMTVQGYLGIGSETCPLSSNVKIVLHGSKPSTLPAPSYVKGIYVTGTLDIHGVIYAPTWTRLARTASAGDTLIYLQDIVNWEPGQRVMLTTTSYKDSLEWHRNDLATIDSVYTAPHLGAHVSVVKLTAGLKYQHYADTEYQAEVALLSRRIVIMGDDASEDSTSSSAGCLDSDSKSYHPCSFISGYGGHVMVNNTGVGKVTGVEFYHMGQTNVMARYPFHFHMLKENGAKSYVRFSSFRDSFYRAVAVHGSNHTLVSNNVAFNITGNCYYVEDGVEEDNLFEFNLGAFVHVMAFTPQSDFWKQQLEWVDPSNNLVVATDIAASPFYITNPANKLIGNAASGGWSGFAFPGLPKPIQLHKNVVMGTPPHSRPMGQFEGNTAHSTGHWWGNGGAIYVGGLFRYDSNGVLQYYPGRIITGRDTCNGPLGEYGCSKENQAWLRFNNTKTFLANRGIMDWGPRTEVVRYEGHDCGKAANAFGKVWVDKMLANCRSRNVAEFLNGCPSANWWECAPRDWVNWRAYVGFEWYDVGQSHIITNVTFRSCDGHWDRCIDKGKCDSAPWNFVTHSDQFLPENMQATARVIYQNSDPTRLWKYGQRAHMSVSGRLQNWRDTDGSASQRNIPTQLGSSWANDWWNVGNSSCVRAPSEMDFWECDLPTTTASMMFQTDAAAYATVGNTACGNGDGSPCPALGYVNHIYRPNLSNGLLITANPKATGLVDDTLGGGWYIRWYAGAPKSLTITNLQMMKSGGSPGATMLVAIPYPAGTTFTVTAKAADWCYSSSSNLCTHKYQQMSSLSALRSLSSADGYFWDSKINVLYVSVVQQRFDGLGPGTWDPFRTPDDVFTREGITLVGPSTFRIVVDASCTASKSNSNFCSLDNSDFNVVRSAIGAPKLTKSTAAPTKSTAAPTKSTAAPTLRSTVSPVPSTPSPTPSSVLRTSSNQPTVSRSPVPSFASSISTASPSSGASKNTVNTVVLTSASTATSTVYRFSFSSVPEQTLDTDSSQQNPSPSDSSSNSSEPPVDTLPSGTTVVQDSSAASENIASSKLGISLIAVASIVLASAVAGFIVFRVRQQRKLKPQALQVRVSAQL